MKGKILFQVGTCKASSAPNSSVLQPCKTLLATSDSSRERNANRSAHAPADNFSEAHDAKRLVIERQSIKVFVQAACAMSLATCEPEI